MAKPSLIKPPRVPSGATFGVFTPSTPAHVTFREKYLHGLSVLRSLGYQVKEGELTAQAKTQGYRAGSPKERAEELMKLILDPKVHGIISTIGGENSSSLIPYLDFDAIRAHPKVICGYSDVTALHLAILRHAGLSTFYGPAVVPSFGEWPTVLSETLESFQDAVSGRAPSVRSLHPPKRWSNHFRDAASDAWKVEPRNFEDNPGWRALRSGQATAPLIAANLNTLISSAGTPSFPDLEGKILLIEEMFAPMGRLERNLRQLQRMGVFDVIAGLVVGKPEVFQSAGAPFTHEELVLEIVGDQRTFPIITEFDCGHTHPMLTLSQGVHVTIEAKQAFETRFTAEESMVE